MVETIISSVITGGIALLVCIINNNTNLKKRDTEQETKLAVIGTKIESLTEEVRQHNNFAVRIPALEVKLEALEKRISVLESKV